jgi:hypothetical protein
MLAPLTNLVSDSSPANNMYNYDNLVSAFKDALGQMKVVLDDEELGTFVEKTVADAIFT